MSSLGTQRDLSQGTKRIAEGLQLFYQRHLVQVTITCNPAATGMYIHTPVCTQVLWILGKAICVRIINKWLHFDAKL